MQPLSHFLSLSLPKPKSSFKDKENIIQQGEEREHTEIICKKIEIPENIIKASKVFCKTQHMQSIFKNDVPHMLLVDPSKLVVSTCYGKVLSVPKLTCFFNR